MSMGIEIEVNNLEEMCDLMCDNKLPKAKVKTLDEKIKVNLKVNNLPSYDLEKYTVFRLVECGLWFYGTYETEDRADEVAKELGNALVVELEG